MLRVNLRIKDITRIFSRIQVDSVSGCWNWKGCISGGYGNVSYRGKSERAHRILYAWAVGPIPQQSGREGRRSHIRQLDHVVCQNTHCCNPAHLELVTQKVNILRGKSIQANRARQTHCQRGHLLPGYTTEGGRPVRRCRVCHQITQRQAYLVRRARGYYL